MLLLADCLCGVKIINILIQLSELVLLDFAGQIKSFYVSLTGYLEMRSYSLSWSVTAATFCSCHNLLLTAGGPDHPLTWKSRLVGRASHGGIVALMLLNDSPHYLELLDDQEQSVPTSQAWLRALLFISSAPIQDFITNLSISNCGSRLAVLHQSGTLSVWLIPSLVLESSRRLEEQHLHDECNPQLLQVLTDHASFLLDFLHPRFLREAELKESFIQPS